MFHRDNHRRGITKAFSRGILLVMAACLLGGGCEREGTKRGGGQGPREAVTIGIAAETLSAPLLIAQAQGYFADEGLDVTVERYPFGRIALESMLAGEVNLATVAETPIVLQSFKRDDFAVAAMFVYNYDDTKVIVRKDRVAVPAGLAGKTIGTSFGTSPQFFLDTYLSSVGIAKSQVKIVDISQKDLPAALQSGAVDAIVAFEPYAHQALQLLPEAAMRLPKVEILKETFNLVVMKDFARQHSLVLPRVLRAMDRAITYQERNRAETIAILVRDLGIDATYLAETWDDYKFGLSLDQAFLVNLEDVARWAIENKLTERTEVPNYLGYLATDALQAVKPEAVRLLQ